MPPQYPASSSLFPQGPTSHSVSTRAPLPPDTICGYRVLRSPSPSTYVALGDGGRQVLLKSLDTDCLLHGLLHPSIKERLARVRELALKSAANLHGVQRDGQGVFLVWEFIEGRPLESHAKTLSLSQFMSTMREVVLSVEALHQVGIVHGALHARNIIIDAAGRPRLTHISPLLFHDPVVDVAALSSLLTSLVEQRRDIDSSVAAALAHPASLRDLASRLVAANSPQVQSITSDDQDHRRRTRMFFLALAVAVAGAITAAVVALLSSRL